MITLKDWLAEVYDYAIEIDVDESVIEKNFELLKIFFDRGYCPTEALALLL